MVMTFLIKLDHNTCNRLQSDLKREKWYGFPIERLLRCYRSVRRNLENIAHRTVKVESQDGIFI